MREKSEDYYNFELPLYTYFNAAHANQSPKLKYRNEYISGDWYVKYALKGNGIARIPKESLLLPGRKFLKWIVEGDVGFTDHLYAIYLATTDLADKLEAMNYEDIKNGKARSKNDFYNDYIEIFSQVIGFQYPLDMALEEYVKEHNINPQTAPVFGESFVTREERDLKTVSLSQDSALLQEHAWKYSYVLSNYTGYHVAELDYFQKRLEDVNHKEFSEIPLKNLKKPETLLEWIGFSVFIRDERKRCNMIFNAMIDRYLMSECKRLNLSHDKAVLLTPEEFEEQKNKKLKDYSGVRFTHATHKGFEDMTESEWNSLIKEESVQSDLVKGTIASKGQGTGPVRIVFGPAEFDKVQQGDVLVTSMTRPEFAPILNKVAAIVTNEGGITCHAAIVSREMKIPCIIATGNATSVLKDGDLVEVDADKGIVRIIKH